MSNKIIVTSEKDRVGKSLYSVKLALELSKANKKVVIVEFSERNKSISEYLDLDEQIIYDLKDALDGVCSIDQAIVNIADKVDILPTPRLKEKLNEIEISYFNKLISELERYYDYVILEVSKLSNAYYINLRNINSVIILNDNEFSSLAQINDDFILLSENAVKNKFIVINKYNLNRAKKNEALNMKDFNKIFPKPIISYVKYDDRYDGLKSDYFLSHGNDELCKAIEDIAQKIR
jgi:septum site-determining protein MinD